MLYEKAEQSICLVLYLIEEFGMNKYQAKDALLDWMENGYRNV